MIKAVFFDIDGTLVSLGTHSIPQSTIDALDALRSRGIKLFICSGRPYCAIDNLEGQQFDGFITVNGGICALDGQTVYRNPIPAQDISGWKAYIERHGTDCFFITESQVYRSSMSRATEDFIELLNFIRPDVRTLDRLDEPIYQMVGLFGSECDNEVSRTLPHCRLARWHHTFSDIVSASSDKSIGMKAILERAGIGSEECMAFGDGANDIGMLRFAGTGVAMGGSMPSVFDAADYVTQNVDDDGIWNALKHFSVI